MISMTSTETCRQRRSWSAPEACGSSREFLHHLQSLGIQFSTSYSLPVIKERFIRWIDEKKYWEPALTADGERRDDAWVIDASKVIELKDYPPGTRIYLRAEPLHPKGESDLVRYGWEPGDRVLDQQPAVQRGVPRCPAPGAGPVREQDQNAEEHGVGQAAVVVFCRESGVG